MLRHAIPNQAAMAQMANHRDANKQTYQSLIRIFGICLGSLLFFYSVLAFRQFFVRETIDATFLLLNSGRIALGAAALVVIANPRCLARRLERQIEAMERAFDAAFRNSATKDRLKLIVLVTMVSLLVELV